MNTLQQDLESIRQQIDLIFERHKTELRRSRAYSLPMRTFYHTDYELQCAYDALVDAIEIHTDYLGVRDYDGADPHDEPRRFITHSQVGTHA